MEKDKEAPQDLYSPKGTRIVATKERLMGRAIIQPGTASVNSPGNFSFEYEGTTEIEWHSQTTYRLGGRRLFVDENEEEFTEDQLTLKPCKEVNEDQAAEAGPLMEIMVGNIGLVYRGTNYNDAEDTYLEYLAQSKGNYGRAAGESVVWFNLQTEQVIREFSPDSSN